MMLIRALSPMADRAALRSVHDRAADYIDRETGLLPGDALVDEFFTDALPGGDPGQGLKLGLFTGPCLDAIADLAFGWPEVNDAYLGLMLVAADQRGRGLGRIFLDHILAEAGARQAPRLLLAVIEANARGRAFWRREGFTEVLRGLHTQTAMRTHVRVRMERRLNPIG
jgi:GNAT superfamily N-acetyltransferase